MFAVPAGSNWTDRQACPFGELPGYWLRREVGTNVRLPVMHLHVGSFPPGWVKTFGGP